MTQKGANKQVGVLKKRGGGESKEELEVQLHTRYRQANVKGGDYFGVENAEGPYYSVIDDDICLTTFKEGWVCKANMQAIRLNQNGEVNTHKHFY